MDQDDKELIGSLVAGGLIGAAFGALLAGADDDGEGVALGALAGAAFLATYRANQKARQGDVPFYVVEQDSLYLVQPGGQKQFVKKIERQATLSPKRFKLKKK
jgi:hypothetical protein